QNLIGPELGEGLGIVRSGELLAARVIDGAGQYFGRAFDFGYSKSAEETFRLWPREVVLSDLVWVIRTFRPHVLVTMWGGTPRDGHGQHQVSGLLTHEAWEAAGDPARFPEQIEAGVEPWTPDKYYRRTFFDPEAATLAIPTGTLDPLLGTSYHQIAMESRSRHRSQDFGSTIPPGPRSTYLALVASRVGGEEADPLFTGVDTTLARLVEPAGDDALAVLATYREALTEADASLSATAPERSFGSLARASEALDRLRSRFDDPRGEVGRELERRRRLLSRALLAVTGVRLELRARDDALVPGQRVLVEARVWNGGAAEVALDPPRLLAPESWTIRGIAPDEDVAPDAAGPFQRFFGVEEPVSEPGRPQTVSTGELRLWRYDVRVPPAARPASPYFLERPRDGAIYRWADDTPLRSLPFRPPLLTGGLEATLSLGGATATVRIEDEVRYRGVTGRDGEFWRPVFVAPRVSVEPERTSMVWPSAGPPSRELAFRLVSHDPEGATGAVELDLPPGWRASPARREFTLAGENDETTLAFTLEPSSAEVRGEFDVEARLSLGGRGSEGLDARVIDYPHLEPRLVVREPRVRIVRFPVLVAERRIGYVMGSGDAGPAAIRELGLDVEPIEPGDWSDERLDRFDTIVLGVRAYEVRDDLIAENDVLLDWVERGGTLVVQYNRYEFSRGDFAPRPLLITRPAPRVTDEAAAVTILDDASPALVEPNRIAPRDFEGWVQERGLYFPAEWDEAYTPLLEMSDADEPPRRGSLLVAPHGDGLYVHTSLSFFRQLPAGVAGAYRLFANLISLDGRRWRETTTSQ
ncbi:MAG: hypothetical protein MJB57_14805, partial [Gemmatimonadetes bacterium]|nr:hypothetical protein [Gemmatimonadota bacterium]